MSGGISAIRGFAYQAAVTLERLFELFDAHGATALVRPEGMDDLDCTWAQDGANSRCFVQIKKPREDSEGNAKPRLWTLSEVARELLPHTMSHLLGNNARQIWIVGDAIHPDINSLITAGMAAPTSTPNAYWRVLHELVRNETLDAQRPERSIRRRLLEWSLPTDLMEGPPAARDRVADEFAGFAGRAGVPASFATRYRQRIVEQHEILPSILARIHIASSYGSELQVAQRVCAELETRYQLSRKVIEDCLFLNLVGFITEISKQAGRVFGQAEFELELRRIWPEMVPLRDVPELEVKHVPRADIAERLTTGWRGGLLELVGISGSGKTSLAAEVAARSAQNDPQRHVYYAEVRPTTKLRNVLAGVGFHLRRIGIDSLFAVSIDRVLTDEEALKRFADECSRVPGDILLLVDLVDGSCSDGFAHDLAKFARALRPSRFRMAVFGQESALRNLTAIERSECEVMRLDIRGFHFEEFVRLTALYHTDPDRVLLWNVFTRVTAGRPAGLFAKLAHSLARAESLEEMRRIANIPPEDILAYAEQQRFARMSDSARRGASKLVCFELPFRRIDAEEVFSDDDIGTAIQELSARGLIRPHPPDAYEMHETVRAGLEGSIAVNVRRSAHAALAAWYRVKGFAAEEVYHLEKANQPAAAEAQARTTFLAGSQWGSLWPYVVDRKLVTVQELINVMASPQQCEDSYLFPTVLRGLNSMAPVDDMLAILRDQLVRFDTDSTWGMAMCEAILGSDPGRLYDLVLLALHRAGDPKRNEATLAWIRTAAQRSKVIIDSRLMELFAAEPEDRKHWLVPFLLLDYRREVLRVALSFLAKEAASEERRRTDRIGLSYAMKPRSRAEAIEFLAAIPAVHPSIILHSKSPLLGSLAMMVWKCRDPLRGHCIEIVMDRTSEALVLANAIRVLIFFAEPYLAKHCVPLQERNDDVGKLATWIPALLTSPGCETWFEERLFDSSAAVSTRISALMGLASMNGDLNEAHRRISSETLHPTSLSLLNFGFLIACAIKPFIAAVPLVQRAMLEADPNIVAVITTAIFRLGELPDESVTRMLTHLLKSNSAGLRRAATMTFVNRRSRSALPALIEQYRSESDDTLLPQLAAAIVASGSSSVSDLSGRTPTDAIRIWQCILAARTRDESFAAELVELATNTNGPWKLRRAAIFAAGRLPYEVATARILRRVAAERSPLDLDKHIDRRGHHVMTNILTVNEALMREIFNQGRDFFVEFFAPGFNAGWQQDQGVPTGIEAAEWLFNRLAFHECADNPEAISRVVNELHTPILQNALLRSLRLNGQWEQLEEQFSQIDHAWLGIKCVQERSRCMPRDSDLKFRMQQRLANTAFAGSVRLQRTISELCAAPSVRPQSAAKAPVASPVVRVSFSEACSALTSRSSDLMSASVVVLEPITADQCKRLSVLADPTSQRDATYVTGDPRMRLTTSGPSIAQPRTSSGALRADALLRPAIAAANRFSIPIEWHESQLSGPLASIYASQFLASLAAMDDVMHLHLALQSNESALIEVLCEGKVPDSILRYMDARIVPFILRHMTFGTDTFFDGLSSLAAHVSTPEVDSALSGLLLRWNKRFDPKSLDFQHSDNHSLWRGFKRLSDHPRFGHVENWQSLLATVVSSNLIWYRADDVFRVLKRHPSSYRLVEEKLVSRVNWEHPSVDQIDVLDSAADLLFHQSRTDL